jgi:CspA family cold shock protein
MPSGKVKWFDPRRGYGFISSDDGGDVYLPASCLPSGVSTLRSGTRVDFSEVDGRRGPEAMDVKITEPRHSVVAATRPKPEDMAAIVEDLIKLLDASGNSLRHRHYPPIKESRKLAAMLRAVADDFDVHDNVA